MMYYCSTDRINNLTQLLPGTDYRLICAGTLGLHCTVLCAALLDLKAVTMQF